MHKISSEDKMQHGLLIAKGHSRFGPVAPRRPYKDDDDGDSGVGGMIFETHPLLSEMPEGAPSDLMMDMNQNSDSIEAAQERYAELNLQLQQQPALQKGLPQSKVPTMTKPM